MPRIIMGIVGILIACLTASAEPASNPRSNWPQWRGPLANGHNPNANPPIAWDQSRNIRWKTPMVGKGSATPIVWGDQIFIVTAIDTGHAGTAEQMPKFKPKVEQKTTPPTHLYQFVVQSFDSATGALTWSQIAAEAVPHEGHHPTHSYAAGSPTTDGKFLYVSFGSRGTFCYTLDGKLVWKRDLGLITTRLGWGESVTPVLHGDSLLLNWDQEADSALICLDAKTGATRWRAERDERTSWNAPLVVEFAGTTQVIVNGTNRVRSYDLVTGQVRWSVGGMTTNAIPTPTCDDKVAYIASGYRGAAAIAIPLESKGELSDAQLKWKYTKGTPYVPSPILINDRLIFTQQNTNQLTILDAQTGKPLVDRERLAGVSTFYGSPVTAAGRIYLTDREGTTLVLKVADSVEVLARNKLDDPVDASPVLVGKQLILRGEKFLYCIEEPPAK